MNTRTILTGSLVFIALAAACLPRTARAVTITGMVEPTTPLGQYMALKMTIDDTKTTFEMTGPDYSFFAFGFNATTMQGYSLIVEGLDATRTVVEQNLAGIGNPGAPQTTQNVTITSTTHDPANNLTTIVVERANSTGDSADPDFSTSMTSLPLIWGYNSFASPNDPQPNLDFHGSQGRGFVTIEFVPEPTGGVLAAGSTLALAAWRRRRAGV
jgi:hypothetical protein